MPSGIEDLVRQYQALPAQERALFATILRAQAVFNTPHWRAELAERNRAVDAGRAVRALSGGAMEPVATAAVGVGVGVDGIAANSQS